MAAGAPAPGPAIGDTPLGATLKVKVAAGARRNAIVGVLGDALKVSVQQAPEKGKANKAVVRLLASAADTRPTDIEVIRGQTSPEKTLRFRDVDAATLRRRILVILDASK